MTHSDCFTSTELFEPSAESHPARIGHITLDVKHTGKPSGGNPPPGFDEAGGSKPAYDSARELLPEETGSNRWAESPRGQTALGDCRGIYFK